MKLVFTSDWHADHVTSGVSRYAEVERAALRSVELAAQVQADAYFFCGDLADPDDMSAVLKASALLTRCVGELMGVDAGVRFFCIPGNHDVIEDGTGVTTLEPVRWVGDAQLVDRPTMNLLPGVREAFNVILLPYVATAFAYDPAKKVGELFDKRDPALPTLIVGHLAVEGIQPGEEVGALARGRSVVLPLAEIAKLPGRVVVVNGHYHRAQTFRSGHGVDVHVPGSLVRLTHGEERHEPSIMVLEV